MTCQAEQGKEAEKLTSCALRTQDGRQEEGKLEASPGSQKMGKNEEERKTEEEREWGESSVTNVLALQA